MLDRRDQGKLVGVVNFEIVGVQIGLNGGRRRRFGLGICLAFIAGGEEQRYGKQSAAAAMRPTNLVFID